MTHENSISRTSPIKVHSETCVTELRLSRIVLQEQGRLKYVTHQAHSVLFSLKYVVTLSLRGPQMNFS